MAELLNSFFASVVTEENCDNLPEALAVINYVVTKLVNGDIQVK